MDKYIQFPSILLAVGFCKSGKTYSIQYTIRTAPKFDFIIVVSNTAEFNGDYDYLKELGINHRIYNTSKINEVMEYAMNTQEKNRKNGVRVNVALIFDDVMGALNNNKVFQKLTSCFRHFYISVLVLTQYCNSQTTYIRELANYIYCFDQRTEQSKKAVYASYFGDIGTFNDFKKTFNGLKPFQFFFIDRVLKNRFIMKCPSQQVKARNISPQVPEPVKVDEKKKFIEQFR